MTLHPNQEILGAVQEGTCADANDTNPYRPDNVKKYLGWQEGHERAVKDFKERQQWSRTPLSRKIMCKVGLHKYSLKLIPGRPHINPETNEIDRRDPIIKKYTCVYCNDIYFIGLCPKQRARPLSLG